jgi:hypothetical protein
VSVSSPHTAPSEIYFAHLRNETSKTIELNVLRAGGQREEREAKAHAERVKPPRKTIKGPDLRSFRSTFPRDKQTPSPVRRRRARTRLLKFATATLIAPNSLTFAILCVSPAAPSVLLRS